MSAYQLGDVVSLSRAQTVVVTVLDPGLPGELYSVALDYNGSPRVFSYEAEGGETVEQLAAAIVALLVQEQTVYSVAVNEEVPSEFAIVGPIGVAFACSTTDNLEDEATEEAVAVLDSSGSLVGPLRVIVAGNVLGYPPREFWTRDSGPGNSARPVERLSVRELGTGNTLDIDAANVLTVLEHQS